MHINLKYTEKELEQITYKLLDGKDEKNIQAELDGLKKIDKNSSAELSTRLKYMIASVDGDTNRAMITEFAKNMLSRDSLALREYLKKVTPDIDTTFAFACNNCEFENLKMAVPITVQFFWPGA